MEPTERTDSETSAPPWTAISRNERRVLGVLVEKAKTTPSAYPLTLNALRNGSNQKSNRFPQVEFEEHHVEAAIDLLRQKGAVSIIQGDSRVEKYRHLAYDWLGVEKAELAVMAELLLRGAQTVGELRGRAARMEPIAGMSELQPILQSLVEKNLVLYVTPPGRGAIVTHNLYEPQELEKVLREHGGGVAAAQPPAAPAAAPTAAAPQSAPAPVAEQPSAGPVSVASESDLRAELVALRVEFEGQIAGLRDELDQLRQQLGG